MKHKLPQLFAAMQPNGYQAEDGVFHGDKDKIEPPLS